MPRFRKQSAAERALARRRDVGLRSARPGYPPLFLGTAAITKMLVEVASLEPVFIENLPDRAIVERQTVYRGLSRALAAGLVRRYRQEAGHERPLWALDQRHPLSDAIRNVLRSVGASNGVRIAEQQAPPLPEDRAYVGKSTKPPRRLFGDNAHSCANLFGSTARTTAIVAVAVLGEVDHSTIARLVGIPTGHRMVSLIDPIVADGVFLTEDFAQFKLCRLPPTRWAEPLKALSDQVVASDAALASAIAAIRTVMTAGVRRKTLKKRLPEHPT